MSINGEWWQVLDVPEESDYKTIKRAYARLIKQYRPDSHPAEFADIRNAYEFGSTFSKNRQSIPDIELSIQSNKLFEPQVQTPGDVSLSEVESYKAELSTEHQKNPKIQQSRLNEQDSIQSHIDEPDITYDGSVLSQNQIVVFVENYNKAVLAWKESKFKDREKFNQIISHPALNNIESFGEIKHSLFELLQNNIFIVRTPISEKFNIPLVFLKKLDDVFDWRNSGYEFEQYFDEMKNQSMLLAINQSHKPKKRIINLFKSTARFSKFLYKAVGIFYLLCVFLFLIGMAIFFVYYMVFDNKIEDGVAGYVFLTGFSALILYLGYKVFNYLKNRISTFRKTYLSFSNKNIN